MSDDRQKRHSGVDGRPYGLMYGFLKRTICSAEGPGQAKEAAPERWDKEELVRFFKRLGTVPQSWSAQRSALRICLAAAEMAGESDSTPSAVYEDLVAFCSDADRGVCREVPLCSECPISSYCGHTSRRPSIKEWPESERPRERLLSEGEEHLSDSELLAIIIGGGTKQESAVALAKRLLSRFGSLRRLAQCSTAELGSLPGIGPAKVARIKAALAIARRFATEKVPAGTAIEGSRQLFMHFHERLQGLKKETFYTILLDTKHRMLGEEQVAVGSLSESVVHPREVFKRAIAESAAAVIFVHNHPSGNPDPSPQDRTLTRRLCEAGRLVGIRVLDHLIIGRDCYFSFAEEGLLDPQPAP